ncbi:lmo0937 family membrane protein [Metabacillus sp. KIGAM252]|uniref:Lmo0937 family membrane protein n=1 Tax=Metabacillus flavus TaxID=2823519 RepID=A0ABS5LHD8_9BACI|nr:lmo0937 family membrane protein [Metabacillus flavus]MBS2970165.1 lmo0937 family membrane protein [Metabacillus flavus]
MLWTIIWILLIVWLIGLVFKIAGAAINLILIIVLALIVVKFVKRKRL